MQPMYTTDMRLAYGKYTEDVRPKTHSKIILYTDTIAAFCMVTKISVFGRIFGVCQTYVSRMSAVCQPYIRRISAVCQPYISRMSAVVPPYVSRISAVCQSYLISQFANF